MSTGLPPILAGLALTDAGLEQAGLDREQRLEVWRASQGAMVVQADPERAAPRAGQEAPARPRGARGGRDSARSSADSRAQLGDLGVGEAVLASMDLGPGAWVRPGAFVRFNQPRAGVVEAEVGWPDTSAGALAIHFSVRRFGGLGWERNGHIWYGEPEPLAARSWDRGEDEAKIAAEISSGFDLLITKNLWTELRWELAPVGWVERIFACNYEAMKRGLLRAAQSGGLRSPIPVLAEGTRLERASAQSLGHPKTALFLPTQAGLRAFEEHASRAGLHRGERLSLVSAWWGVPATWRMS